MGAGVGREAIIYREGKYQGSVYIGIIRPLETENGRCSDTQV